MKRDKGVNEYIAACPPNAQASMKKIRAIFRKAAPQAHELISYRIPAFRGNGMLIYYAACKRHIGMFPPVRGDRKLSVALSRFRGPKGNLRFALADPLPVELIARIAQLRLKQDGKKITTRAKHRQ